MKDDSPLEELEPAYVAGLLDAIGRVRFDVSETGDGQYTVRPMLRADPAGTRMREAVVGEFLESRGYVYDFVEREYGAQFFRLQQRGDLQDLQDYLEGHSVHLVRELEFTNTVFADRFDFDILSPQEAYRFLRTRDELRHGWRPRGRYHLTPEEVARAHDVDTGRVDPPPLPVGDLRNDYTVEWMAGAFDGLCRFRPSIAESDEHVVGYAMYPTANLHRAGVSAAFVDLVDRFCSDYDLNVGDSSKQNELRLTFTGSSNIRRVLDVLLPRLLVLAEHSIAMVEDVLPRFDGEEHHGKQGFYELLRDFEPIARDSGGPYSPHEYDLEYFSDVWGGELDLRTPTEETSPTEAAPVASTTEELEELQEARISLDSFSRGVGRYQSVLDNVHSDDDTPTMLRETYGDRCQICGTRRASGDGTGYAEVHYLKPLCDPHCGPHETANMLVVCPNHHADLDNGVLSIDLDDFTVRHPYDPGVDGRELELSTEHDLEESHVQYHNETICRLRMDS